MTPVALALAFAAGVLSTLSPCVLPLLPIVLSTAVSEHRGGPAALAGGLATSFVAIGLFLATAGYSLGLDGGVMRTMGALVLALIGIVLMVPGLGVRFAAAAAPLAGAAEGQLDRIDAAGLKGQFLLGLLLGVVWSPCVGPTLGAASVLAAQGKDLGQVAVTMSLFGLGAALPLLVLGLVSREAMLTLRGRLRGAGRGGKLVLGGLLLLVGLLVASGLDKRLEAFLVEASPSWLTELTTKL